MIKKEKKVLFIDIIFHSDDEIDDDDYSLSSEDIYLITELLQIEKK